MKPRPTCKKCGRNPVKKKGGGKWRTLCSTCDKNRRSYRLFLGERCSRCGFEPEHACQLHVDHIDGNHANNDPTNLQTMCANCHALKTYTARDHMPGTKPAGTNLQLTIALDID